MFLNALTFSCCEISLCIYSVKERNAGLSEIKVTFMSNIILPLDRSAWNHSDTQIHQTPNLYSSRSFLQFLFWHLFYTVVCSFERSLECRWKQLLAGRCVFEPNPNSCCVLTLPLLCISKWMFLWPVRFFCGNVRHSSLSSQLGLWQHKPIFIFITVLWDVQQSAWLPWPVSFCSSESQTHSFPEVFFHAPHPEPKADFWI